MDQNRAILAPAFSMTQLHMGENTTTQSGIRDMIIPAWVMEMSSSSIMVGSRGEGPRLMASRAVMAIMMVNQT